MDDEVRVLEVTSHILMELSHKVERARDGAKALEKYRGATSTRRRRSLSPPVIPVTLL